MVWCFVLLGEESQRRCRQYLTTWDWPGSERAAEVRETPEVGLGERQPPPDKWPRVDQGKNLSWREPDKGKDPGVKALSCQQPDRRWDTGRKSQDGALQSLGVEALCECGGQRESEWNY